MGSRTQLGSDVTKAGGWWLGDGRLGHLSRPGLLRAGLEWHILRLSEDQRGEDGITGLGVLGLGFHGL